MKILIAEDDFISRILLQEMLLPYGACHLAADGQEALAAFERMLGENCPYDLICLDIMMPTMDGQETLQHIRRIEKERGIGGSDAVKVIMTTALDDPKNIMMAFIKGQCEAYLTKPISPANLYEQLSKLGFASPS